jgi:hypothetical protein
LRFAQPKALGRKISDEFTVPLCNLHHRKLHSCSNEEAWWEERKLSPLAVAQELWAASRRHRIATALQSAFSKGHSARIGGEKFTGDATAPDAASSKEDGAGE